MVASLTRTSRYSKELVGYAAGALGFLVPTLFAFDIYRGVTRDPNTATWLMIWIMDFTGLWIVIAEGNRKPWLQIGWVFAATAIMVVIFIRGGSWDWGAAEFWSLALCILAVAAWQLLKKGFRKEKEGALAGLTFQTLAICISLYPQAKDYWYKPQPETWYLWCFTLVASLMAIYAAKNRRDPAQVFIPWAAALLNLIIWILVIR